MKRVLFFQHGPLDAPGLLAEVLTEGGVELVTRHPWRGEAVPDTLADFDGLAIGGGGQSAYQETEYPYLIAEKALVRDARARHLPALGLCLGAQVIASALGAEVKPNTEKEIGFYPVEFTPAAADDLLCHDLAMPFVPAHWHGDTFALPAGAVHLASSSLTAHQLFACDGRLYGMQFHLEMTTPILQAMIRDDADYLESAGVDSAAFAQAAEERLGAIEATARTVFQRWSTLL